MPSPLTVSLNGNMYVTSLRGGTDSLAGVQTPQKTGDVTMALTRDFKETIQARVQRDPAFREEFTQGRHSVPACRRYGCWESNPTGLHQGDYGL